MSSRPRNGFTQNAPTGYTLIVCDTCDEEEPADLEALRECVRRTRHGMPVRTRCPLGQMWCHARRTSEVTGRAMLVQWCTTDRSPLGAAILIGPVRTAADVITVARWLDCSPLDATALPPHLRRIRTRGISPHGTDMAPLMSSGQVGKVR